MEISHAYPVETTPHIDAMSPENLTLPRLYLLYHELRSSEGQYSYAIHSSVFEQHLDLYARLRKRSNISLWPEITFDDGHISNFELAAPLLQSRNLSARFFITAGWTEKKPEYMRWDHLHSLLQAGHSIGAHGWTHTLLTHCSDAELENELRGTRLTLEDKLGTAITTMSLPGGRHDRRILAACKNSGYTQVYTSIPRAEPLPTAPILGRLNILAQMQTAWIEKLFEPGSTLLQGLERQSRRKDIAKKILGDRMYAKLWAVVNRQEVSE